MAGADWFRASIRLWPQPAVFVRARTPAGTDGDAICLAHGDGPSDATVRGQLYEPND